MDTFDFIGHFVFRTVRFAEQNRLRIQVVTRMQKFFDRMNGDFVHHFHSCGDNPGGNHVGNGIACFLDIVKGRHDELRFFRYRNQFYGNFGYDTEHAFTAGHQCQQIKSCTVECIAADFQYFAVNRQNTQFKDVMYRQAILQAMHTTGIFRHISTDGTSNLR